MIDGLSFHNFSVILLGTFQCGKTITDEFINKILMYIWSQIEIIRKPSVKEQV